jgi:AcrR family transcriptional regulator
MSTKRGFHHGDLRATLLELALEAVERDGHDGVSLRELAATAGVSTAAPYRHFPDRRALLSAVAGQGFVLLDRATGAAIRPGASPRAQLRVGARAFLDFAAARPQLFRLMFSTDLLAGPTPPEPARRQPANESYGVLEHSVSAAYPSLAGRELKARVLAMWSTMLGFAWARGDGRIKPFMREPLTEAELEEAILTAATGVGPEEL